MESGFVMKQLWPNTHSYWWYRSLDSAVDSSARVLAFSSSWQPELWWFLGSSLMVLKLARSRVCMYLFHSSFVSGSS